MSAEGIPVFAPGEWTVAESSDSEDSSNVDSFDCRMHRISPLGQMEHWFPPEDVKYRSLPARHSTDVWDFASILYRVSEAARKPPGLYDLLSFKSLRS